MCVSTAAGSVMGGPVLIRLSQGRVLPVKSFLSVAPFQERLRLCPVTVPPFVDAEGCEVISNVANDTEPDVRLPGLKSPFLLCTLGLSLVYYEMRWSTGSAGPGSGHRAGAEL